MSTYAHLSRFAGKTVEDYDPDEGLSAPIAHALALRLDLLSESGGVRIVELLEQLLAEPAIAELEALVIGAWALEEATSSHALVSHLVAHAEQLPKLRALFVGDATCYERDLAEIRQSDLTPLLQAFPSLVELGIRGGRGLLLGPLEHSSLQRLTLQSSGLGAEVLESIANAKLPALERLELWLGERDHGCEATPALLSPIFRSEALPRLKHLALENAEALDPIVVALAASPLLSRLESLSLSMGTLGDAGARALVEADGLRTLKVLDVRHHYMTDEWVARLREVVPTVHVTEDDPQLAWRDADENRIRSVEVPGVMAGP